MSDTSSELNYGPLPLSPAPSEVPEEDPYEACSDEEDNDDEDDSMKFQEMGATWEPVVNAFAGSSFYYFQTGRRRRVQARAWQRRACASQKIIYATRRRFF